jgi:enoyl-CoA hydratase
MPVRLSIEDGVASVVIDRPEVMNAVSPEVLEELHQAIDQVESSGARVLILSGAGGRAFSAGADLAEMLEFSAARARAQLDQGTRLTRRLEQGPFISIAAVTGYALGGGTEIALACSLRFADPTAKFGLPEVTVGIFPGWGGAVRLPRQIPLALAQDVILSGRILTAEEALRSGLVCDVVEDPSAAARAAAARLLKAGPEAQLLARRVLQETGAMELDAALELSSQRWMELMDSPQRVEGHRAFIEKRAPDWTRS